MNEHPITDFSNTEAGTKAIYDFRGSGGWPIYAEYSSKLQLQLLQLELNQLKEPILDLGCGEHYHLIKYLAGQGADVLGLDINTQAAENVMATNWFHFSYRPQFWGTIISHMAFSNQFIHNHLRIDGQPVQFAYCYRQILDSLKIGGSFIYTPGLPFIEQFLSPADFEIKVLPITPGYGLSRRVAWRLQEKLGDSVFYTTYIKRLR